VFALLADQMAPKKPAAGSAGKKQPTAADEAAKMAEVEKQIRKNFKNGAYPSKQTPFTRRDVTL